jgi:hypothetical protein
VALGDLRILRSRLKIATCSTLHTEEPDHPMYVVGNVRYPQLPIMLPLIPPIQHSVQQSQPCFESRFEAGFSQVNQIGQTQIGQTQLTQARLRSLAPVAVRLSGQTLPMGLPNFCQNQPPHPSDQAAAPTQPWPPDCLLQFDFGELPPFVLLNNQYQAWGLTLAGAITIRPSNPIFVSPEAQASSIGLMPAVAREPIVLQFQQTRQIVNFKLLSVSQIVIKAFDAADRLISEQQIGHLPLRSGSGQS